MRAKLGVLVACVTSAAVGSFGCSRPTAPFSLRDIPDRLVLRPGVDEALAVSVRFRGSTAGTVVVTVEDLPSGVTVTAASLTKDQPSSAVVFHVPADAIVILPAHASVVARDEDGDEVSAPIDLTVQGAPGTLDLTFGSNGVFTYEGGFSSSPNAIAIKSDGNIFLAGTQYDVEAPTRLLLVGLDPAGQLRPDFGDGGTLVESWAGSGAAAGLEVGKILIAGQHFDPGGPHTLLARVDEHGSLDLSFGQGGGQQEFLLGGIWDAPTTIAPAPDASTWVAGMVATSVSGSGATDTEGVLMHVSRDGASFEPLVDGPDAIELPFGATGQVVRILLQDDGKVLALVGGSRGSELVRFLANGAADETFGADGVVPISDDFMPITMCSDGSGIRVVEEDTDRDDTIVVRVLPDGRFDDGFGSLRVHYAIPVACHAAADGQGTYIAAAKGRYWSPAIIGIDANGNLDSRLGDGTGVAIFADEPANWGMPAAITLDPQGRVVVAGAGLRPPNDEDDVMVWRVWP